MAILRSYLTSTKNMPAIMASIQSAKAPDKFTVRYLEDLGYKGSADRLIIAVLKGLGFLDSNGVPTRRYHEYLDQAQGPRILGQAIESAYDDLFRLNRQPWTLSPAELKGKFRSLTEGKLGDSSVDKMVATFQGFAKLADFSQSAAKAEPAKQETTEILQSVEHHGKQPVKFSYTIYMELPKTSDKAVYDALFRSLKEHLG